MEPSLRSRVRDGAPDAFGVLFDDYARSVHNLAFRLTGNRQEAEEVVSLTFLEAWRLRSGIESDGESLRPWLMGIAVNVVRNFSRASRRQRAAMVRLPRPQAVPDFADELAGRIDDAAQLAVVRAAFGKLRPASPAVVELLAKVANAAAQQPVPRVSDNEFMYIRSEEAYASYTNNVTPIMEPLHERQVWLPVANVCDYGLLIENGQRTSLAPNVGAQLSGGGPSSSVECGLGDLDNPTYRVLQSLPTDPRTLLNQIYAFNQVNGEGQAVGRDGEAFITIGDLIREMIVPPSNAAALYRAAALIPGVTLIGRVTTIEGQPGIAIAWTNSQHRYEWIFDPATLQYVGEREYDMSTGKPVMTGNNAVVQRAFVNKAGQLP